MFSYRNLSITHKLKLIVMLTCMLAIVGGSIIRMGLTYVNHRQDLVRDLSGLAAMIGQNTSVALAFKIPEDGEKALRALSQQKSIRYAGLFDASGKLFAAYSQGAQKNLLIPEALAMGGHKFDSHFLHLVFPIQIRGQGIGTLYLLDDMSSLSAMIRRDILIDVLIILGALGVAFLIASRLQSLITRPVLSLARTAEFVSHHKDYSVRVSKEHADEVGSLIDAFNEMLSQIQQNAEVIKESEGRFRTLIESAPVAIAIVRKSKIVYVNSTYATMHGFSVSGELVGQSILDRIAPEGLADFTECVRRREQEITVAESFEGTALRKDGIHFSVLAAVTQVNLADGPATICYFQDITSQRRLEEEFRHAQKMEAVGQLAGGVAHDFNNILAAIMMNLGLLEVKASLDNETRIGLKDLQVEAERAASLTRQLLMFSRRSVLDRHILDLNGVVADLLKMLARLVGENIKLLFERSHDLPFVEADAGMLEQVLMNLVVNARDAMPKGGRIVIAAEAVIIDPVQANAYPSRHSGRFVCLSVSDTGCGMDARTLERIFEPFFTTKEPGKGTGLGLATVDGIVSQHKGWVEVDSRLETGTTFRVYLPVSKEMLIEPERIEPEAVLIGKETILLVEDEAAVRQLIVRTLRKWGYHVFEAANGQLALTLLRECNKNIDLLFTDMVMPEGMTGLELAEKLRSDKPDLKVIISSGYSAEIAETSRITAAGITYLPKPYSLSLLGKTIRQCLDKHEPIL